ncbi:MAG: DNA-directed RNA polymerase subunit A'' [Candidatus Diapherotrites archaeon]|nr:DNA-directed RNA polymerase subunit A'' [Candidatus Diapherotrites archaeon]
MTKEKEKKAREKKAPREKKAKHERKKKQEEEKPVVERLYAQDPIIETRVIPELMQKEFDAFVKEQKLSEKESRVFFEEVSKKYSSIQVEPGEAVGIIAAQSLGEPGTQLTLRTKHYAGAAEVSVGSGIQRVEEIVDGRSKARYASMTIYLSKEGFNWTEKKVDEFAASLIDVRVTDVVKITEEFWKTRFTIELLPNEMKERNVSEEILLDKIEKLLKLKHRKKDNSLEFAFKDEPLLKIRKNLNKLLNTRVQGVKGIDKTIVEKGTAEPVIRTRGTNLKAVLKMPEIDVARTTTNDIKEISRVLGIEAGRTAVMQELVKVLKDNSIAVDQRHIMLLADLMSFDGEIKGIVRTGITRTKTSPFARAAFEETVKHLLDAAFKGEKELLQGVVENIIAGQPIKVGTGTVELLMKN